MTQRRQNRANETVNGRPADLDHELTRGFAGRRIRFRAWQLAGTCGFSPSDRADIEQDLRMALFERIDRFDPERAHWNVFVYTVIERAIASMFSGRTAAERTAAFESDSLSTLVATEDNEQTMLAQLVLPEDQARVNGRAIRHHEDEVNRAEDVETILDMLPDELRDIAERLKTTPPAALARELNIPRRTLRDQMKAIRAAFTQAGYQPPRTCRGRRATSR